MPESKEVFKECWGIPKRHRSQLEGAPTGPIWDNLKTKIITVMHYSPLNKMEIYESILSQCINERIKEEKAFPVGLPTDEFRRNDGIRKSPFGNCLCNN